MKFRNRSIYVYILKNMYEAKRDGNANMIRRIGVITLFASHGIYFFTYSMLIMILRNTKFLAFIFSTHTTVVYVSII